jgi:Delta7-sterol 5-desaturase
MDYLYDQLNAYVVEPFGLVDSTVHPTDSLLRQLVTVFLALNIGGALTYLVFGGLTYLFLFDKRIRLHPNFLPNQERLELYYSLVAVPWISLLTAPIFVAQMRGYSLLYDASSLAVSHSINQNGTSSMGLLSEVISMDTNSPAYIALSLLLFILFGDFAVYWVHRALHLKWFYGPIHKTHHLFKVHTPFAALAFHPLDGWSQSLPYHLFVFMVPFHKVLYLSAFGIIQLWTIMIHDHFFVIPPGGLLDEIVNGSAHHSDHHEFFNYNHGLYFTLWDRIGGTYRKPAAAMGRSAIETVLKEQLASKTNDLANPQKQKAF